LTATIERGRLKWQLNRDLWHASVLPCVQHIETLINIIHEYYGRYYLTSSYQHIEDDTRQLVHDMTTRADHAMVPLIERAAAAKAVSSTK
jgi:hypothetical protein